MHDVARDTLTILTQLEPPTSAADLATLHRVVEALTEQLRIVDGDFARTFRCSPGGVAGAARAGATAVRVPARRARR